MSANNFESEEYTVDDAIREDTPGLFSLADQIIDAAPNRKWKLWVSEAKRAYFVTRFLSDVCSQAGVEVPPIVSIVTSRSVRKLPEHQEAITRRISETDIRGGTALILSEYTSSWRGIDMLSDNLRRAGAVAVDAAILNIGIPSPYAEPPAAKPAIIYSGRQNAQEPGLTFSIMTDAIPHLTIAGHAEPQPNPYADMALHDQVSGAFSELAQTYTASRGLS